MCMCVIHIYISHNKVFIFILSFKKWFYYINTITSVKVRANITYKIFFTSSHSLFYLFINFFAFFIFSKIFAVYLKNLYGILVYLVEKFCSRRIQTYWPFFLMIRLHILCNRFFLTMQFATNLSKLIWKSSVSNLNYCSYRSSSIKIKSLWLKILQVSLKNLKISKKVNETRSCEVKFF